MRPLEPGSKVRVFYGKGNLNNELRHIRVTVDEDMIVYCTWWKHHRRWNYKIVHISEFEMGFAQGAYKKVTR